MTEKSYFWAGTAIGDASLAPYTDDAFSDFISGLLHTYRNYEGVFYKSDPDFSLFPLAVTAGLGSSVTVYSGNALVDGKLYVNTGTETITLTTLNSYYVVGLRKDFTSQTIRLFNRSGYASHAAALASMVRTAGVTWEIPLATVYVSGVGAVTVVDQRRFMNAPIMPHKYVTGDSTNVNFPGSSEFTGKPSVIYHGCVEIAFGNGDTTASVTVSLSYPVLFTNTPAVYLTMIGASSGLGVCHVTYDAATSTNTSLVFKAKSSVAAGVADVIQLDWLAIGWMY